MNRPSGLDVLSKERLRQFLAAERRRVNMILLLTTHDMRDIERLCDRVLVVDHGRLAYDGTIPDLARLVALRRVLVLYLVEPHPALSVPGTEHLGSELDGLRQRLGFAPESTTAAEVLTAVGEQAEIRDLTLDEPAIDGIVATLYRP
jgi:ABC-2 type transport system ATP-binding protein